MFRAAAAGPLLGKIGGWRRKNKQLTPPRTPVSSMRGFWGLMGAYWRSERWREAWLLTIAIIIFTIIDSKMIVLLALAAADVFSSIAYFQSPDNKAPLEGMLSAIGWLALITITKDIGVLGVRHIFSATLHRKWRGWLNGRFNQALLDGNHTHLHVQNWGRADGASQPPPDNIDQRVQESIKGMTGGAIGLAMGGFGAIMAIFFVGQQLLRTTAPVRGFEFLGEYGTAGLALAAVVLYVPIGTFLALRLGRIMQWLANAMQQAEGTYRGELNTMLRRSFQVAAANGEAVQKKMHSNLYATIDNTWFKLVFMQAGYQSFERVYNFVAMRVVAYLPLIGPYASGSIGLKAFIAGAEMINSVIGKLSWIIDVMPEIATLRANAKRVTGLAEAIEQVQTPPDYYGGPERSAFQYRRKEGVFALSVHNLRLNHDRENATFVQADDLHFVPGEWTFLQGESGCGKTSLIKAVNGLWPFGSGEITMLANARSYYASQDVKLPRLSLKELICLPELAEDHTDARVASALHKAGLGDFIENLGDPQREGKAWDDLLSGGQKQRLVLARILLNRPDIIFLDEATGALDPTAKIEYHQAIKDNLPSVTVISIMHETHPPHSFSGEPFYQAVVRFRDGVAVKEDLPVGVRGELKLVSSKTAAPAVARSKGKAKPAAG